ncbi:MAG: SDR family NAD(P)-dependent oxidoreductase [Pseudomonadota bacterium]
MAQLDNQTCIITGANGGIGYVTTRDLARLGAHVVMVCRNEQRGLAARDAIRQETGNPRVGLLVGDTSSLADMRRVAAEILEGCPRIDVLIANAGGAMGKRTVTAEGFENTLATNHLGHYLLTRLLLDRLLADGGARVVVTSSHGHKSSGAIDFDDLNMERRWGMLKAYGLTKLMNVLMAQELDRRFGEQGLRASSFHPGAVRTGIWNKAGFLGSLVGAVGGLFMISSEQGADTMTWLATSAEAADPQGQYYYQRKRRRISPHATQDAAKRLWEMSAELVGLQT